LEFRRLIPDPAAVDAADLLAGLELQRRAGEQRPYTIVNFIASADGRAAFDGRSGALGDQADRALFHGLREQADAVLAGTGTLRTERYGRLVKDPQRREHRVRAGRSAEPLTCVVTRSGQVPAEIPMFSDPESRIVIFTPVEPDLSEAAAQVELVLVDRGELTLTTVLRRLRTDFGIAALLCEGGPTVFGALLQEQLVDELFLTIAPKLTGGGMSPTISSGPELTDLEPLDLLWALEHSGALYLRYGLR
jgi:riboflavin-specific deaminase-like protein